MSPRQQRFVEEYLLDLNATRAARIAGYSAKTAASQGQRLLIHVEVSEAIRDAQAQRSERTRIQADDVLREIARLFFEPIPNIADLFDANGNLKPARKLTRAEARMIASCEVIKKNAETGDGKVDVIHKVKLWDIRASKARHAELLMRHLGLVDDPKDERPQVPAFALPPETPGVSVH